MSQSPAAQFGRNDLLVLRNSQSWGQNWTEKDGKLWLRLGAVDKINTLQTLKTPQLAQFGDGTSSNNFHNNPPAQSPGRGSGNSSGNELGSSGNSTTTTPTTTTTPSTTTTSSDYYGTGYH